MLLEAHDEDGRGMSDQELRDELFTLLMAGHETTATSLGWIFWCVLERPEVQDRIRAELQLVAGEGDLDPRRVSDLTYLDAVTRRRASIPSRRASAGFSSGRCGSDASPCPPARSCFPRRT
jgi:cytochrome P450